MPQVVPDFQNFELLPNSSFFSMFGTLKYHRMIIFMDLFEI